GAQRIEQISKASGIDPSARASAIDAARRRRHALLPLDPSNWRRLFVRNGRVLSALPELDDDHPLQRPERVASLLAVMKSFPVTPNQVSTKPGTEQELASVEQTLIRPKHDTEKELAADEQTLINTKLNMRQVATKSAKIYAFQEIQQNEQIVQRITNNESYV